MLKIGQINFVKGINIMIIEVYKTADNSSGAQAIRINELAGSNVNNAEKGSFLCKLSHPLLIQEGLLNICNIGKNGAGYKVRTRDPLITNHCFYYQLLPLSRS